MKRIITAVIDYGAGNLRSVEKALKFLGSNFLITSDPEELLEADAVILPGVGAFPEAMKQLELHGLKEAIIEFAAEQQKPFLGICLGMQMLFDKSYEFAETPGLGLINGTVEKIEFNGLKIPHMGWNSLDYIKESPFCKDISLHTFCYFVHSYKAVTDNDNVIAFADYGSRIPALVGRDNIFGAQFHPEKSGEAGLTMLKNYYEWIAEKT